jgi:ABC-type cobalamin transport system permease subunit
MIQVYSSITMIILLQNTHIIGLTKGNSTIWPLDFFKERRGSVIIWRFEGGNFVCVTLVIPAFEPGCPILDAVSKFNNGMEDGASDCGMALW